MSPVPSQHNRPVKALYWTLIAALLLGVFAPSLATASPRILLGIDRLSRNGYAQLQGKRIGLLTHPAGVNKDGISTIRVLHEAPNVNLVALYGPEHGIYGDEKANQPIQNRIDSRTGLPVFSLYGKYRKPTAEMLSKIDALVVDLQDIGTRSYTYVSCMKLAMEACFEQGKEIIILDRPNPLGGIKVDGPIVEKELKSYVGAFPVPYVHGLTIGELARIAQSTPGWLDLPDNIRLRGKLTVIPMLGWNRHTLWPQTGLKWIPTSPYIPDLSAVLGYPMTGLGAQIGGFRHGIGTDYPFRLLSYPGKPTDEVWQALTALQLPGVVFEKKTYKKSNGQYATGLYVTVTDYQKFRPTELSFYMMQLSAAWDNNPFQRASFSEARLFNKHVGSQLWWDTLASQGARINVSAFITQWQREAAAFREHNRQYWLYR